MSDDDWARRMEERGAFELEARALKSPMREELVEACAAAIDNSKRERANQKAWAAVEAMSPEDLRQALEEGAVFEEVRRIKDVLFWTRRWVDGSVDIDRAWTPMDAWIAGVAVEFSPGAKTKDEREERADFEQRALAVGRLLELGGGRLRPEFVAKAAGAEEAGGWLKRQRLLDLEWWSKWSIPFGTPEECVGLFLSLLAEWTVDDPASGGLGLEDWRRGVAAAARNSKDFAFAAEARIRAKTGQTLSAEDWALLIAGPRAPGKAGLEAFEAVRAAIEDAREISAWSSAWLMCFAIKQGSEGSEVSDRSVELLKAVAEKCPAAHWKAPKEAGGWLWAMPMVDWDGEMGDLSMLHFAVGVANARKSAWDMVRILSRLAMMREAAQKSRSVDVFHGYDLGAYERVVEEFPLLEGVDREGNNVAHAWARSIRTCALGNGAWAVQSEMREKLIPLLSSKRGALAEEPNHAGETATSILATIPDLAGRAEWEEAHSAWEAAELSRKLSGSAPEHGSSNGARRI